MSLRDLYQEIIVDHGKTPRNTGQMPDATHCQCGHNPLCGDRLTLYIKEKSGTVDTLCFEGTGCAISMASASLMTEAVKGKSIIEIKKLYEAFHQLVTEGKTAIDVGKLMAFSGVAEFPVRVKCATLAWHALISALSNDSNSVTTE